MSNVSRPNASKAEVKEWIRAFQLHQDEEAQEKLVKHYRYLVDSIARKYSNRESHLEDMFQVGIIGLLSAIRRYDETYGKSFEAFAIPTIIGEIKRFLRDKTWSVHVPRRVKELGPRIKVATDELTRELQRSPQIYEIAERVEVSEEELLETLEMSKSYQTLSVDHSMEMGSEGNTFTLLDIVGKIDSGYEKINQRLALEKVIHILTEREKKIIQYTYLENMTQKDVGKILGISQMHVSRIQRKAIEKLRQAIHNDNLSKESASP